MNATPNVAASVMARLLSRSKARGDDYQLLVTAYAFERLLYRLGQSLVRDRFVLKGAMLLRLWSDQPYRATRDLDLLRRGDGSSDAIRADLEAIIATPVPDDGIDFDATRLVLEPMRADDEYVGTRAILPARCGKARLSLQMDLGVGDAVWPEPIVRRYPALLDAPAPEVFAYARETVVAEKLEALVVLGNRNSRIKDFFDLHMLATTFTFDRRELGESVRRTFERRRRLYRRRHRLASRRSIGRIHRVQGRCEPLRDGRVLSRPVKWMATSLRLWLHSSCRFLRILQRVQRGSERGGPEGHGDEWPMNTDRSSPVRSPSDRIRATHQSGCRLRGFAYAADANGDSVYVVASANVAARREVNIDNGDFSTSYFALAFDRRTGRIIDVTGAMRRSREWGTEYQVHPPGLKPGGADRDQASAYGTHARSSWAIRAGESSCGRSSSCRRLSLIGAGRASIRSGDQAAAARRNRGLVHL